MSKGCNICGPKSKKLGKKDGYDIEELRKLVQEDTEKGDERELILAQKKTIVRDTFLSWNLVLSM